MNYNQNPYNFNPNLPDYNNQQPQPMPFDIPKNNEIYLEELIGLNKGKLITIYLTFDDSNLYRDKAFKGIIVGQGKDHVTLCDPKCNKYFVIPLIYTNWIEFDEEVCYLPIKKTF